MSDASVAALLRSSASIATIEAAAGCGKTHQAANYVAAAAQDLDQQQVLVLTHTHAACAVVKERTRAVSKKVDIKTIDALICEIAAAYHLALGLPSDPARHAQVGAEFSFETIAEIVSDYVEKHSVIAQAIARRFPIVVCDEHQDSSAAQHKLVMAIHAAGAKIRFFGDPMQRIFGGRSDAAVRSDLDRWDGLRDACADDQLLTPHRWRGVGKNELGAWIGEARERLKNGGSISLRGERPEGLSVIYVQNTAPNRGGYRLNRDDRRRIGDAIEAKGQMLILAANNSAVASLNGFWGRRYPIWEGHKREHLSALVEVFSNENATPEEIARGATAFMSSVAKGFSNASHGDRLVNEVQEGCRKATRGKPANIQSLARCILERPNHRGVAACLKLLHRLVNDRSGGFSDVAIDFRREFHDAIRLGDIEDPLDGFAEITQRRSRGGIALPDKAISTVHKSKGLECENAMLVVTDRSQLSGTLYSRRRLYVALSRARHTLTLVLPSQNDIPLIER